MSLVDSHQFKKDFEVGSYQVHPDGKISLAGLADLFQEIAWKHSDSGDFGRNLMENKLAWILSRFDIRCESFPLWGDSIKIYTASQGMDRLTAFREFLVTDTNGNVLAKAMSSWVLMNVETKRLKRPESVLPMHLLDPELKPTWQPEKIKMEGEIQLVEKIQVKYSDLDLYNHVNNTSYIRWVEDLLKVKGWEHSNILINYQAECHLNNEIDLTLAKTSTHWFIQGKTKKNQIFLAKTRI